MPPACQPCRFSYPPVVSWNGFVAAARLPAGPRAFPARAAQVPGNYSTRVTARARQLVIRARACARARTRARVYARAHARTHTHANTRAHARADAHVRTHTKTQRNTCHHGLPHQVSGGTFDAAFLSAVCAQPVSHKSKSAVCTVQHRCIQVATSICGLAKMVCSSISSGSSVSTGEARSAVKRLVRSLPTMLQRSTRHL